MFPHSRIKKFVLFCPIQTTCGNYCIIIIIIIIIIDINAKVEFFDCHDFPAVSGLKKLIARNITLTDWN